ncbi:hypothetical protein [Liquorilactobacillus vini]|uniref:ABC transporter, permease n=1 Tax=Liquorilactobacillus vini DSM 20605 TaxID=1133569 RepID=A0A0R2CL12_9LACO|nr:hypothetical protein [Liquorilactobacillus vini]KRM88483.1 ABC transporter, permease [Liquorilactobacillus vini DSM 20605]
MSERQKGVITYLFRNTLRQMGYVFAWALFGILLIPLLIEALTTNQSINFAGELRNFSLGPVLLIILAIISMRNYDDFQFMIQNGVSRKIFWQSKMVVLSIAALITQLFGYLYRCLISNFLGSDGWQQASLYMTAYGKFAGSAIINQILAIIFSLLFAIALVLGMDLIGSIFSLFPKKQKYLIGVALLTIGVVGLTVLSNWSAQHQNQALAIVSLFSGYSRQRAIHAALNPTMPFIELIGVIIVSLLGTRLTFKHFQIRND